MQNLPTININRDFKTRRIWYAYLDKLILRRKELQTVNTYSYNYYTSSNETWNEWVRLQAALDFDGDVDLGILTFKNVELMTELVLTHG